MKALCFSPFLPSVFYVLIDLFLVAHRFAFAQRYAGSAAFCENYQLSSFCLMSSDAKEHNYMGQSVE